MRRAKYSFGIPAGATCGDRIGTKWLLFMHRIYDLDMAREIAADEGPGALVVDDGPQCWAVVVLGRAARSGKLNRRASRANRPVPLPTLAARKQAMLF